MTYFATDAGQETLLASSQVFRLGIDIDDVLHPWGMTAHGLCEAAGLTGGNMYTGWKMWEDYGCTEEQWAEVITRAVHEGGLYDVPPIPGAVEALRRLLFAGHEIHLVTARGFMQHGELIREHTTRWIEQYAVPCDSLVFEKNKPDAVRRLGLDYFLDDGIHNFQAIERECLPGCQPYLLTAPHNATFYTPFRLDTVGQFADLILEAAEQ